MNNTHGGVLLLVKLQVQMVPNRITFSLFPHNFFLVDPLKKSTTKNGQATYYALDGQGKDIQL